MNERLRFVFSFSEFRLDTSRKVLSRGYDQVALRSRDVEVLEYLIVSSPEVCSHDAIINAVWDDVVVENNSVEKAIANIRHALGDDAQNPRFIKTFRGKGYLFVDDVFRQELPQIRIQSPTDERNSNTFAEYFPQTNWRNGAWKIPASFAAILIFVFLGTAAYLKNGFPLGLFSGRTIIFYDDFSGDEINRTLWNVKGKSVHLKDGIARAVVEETDNGVKLESILFPFDRSKPVIIKGRIKVSYSRNLKDKVYFFGGFHITPKTPIYHEADIHNKYLFGIHYTNKDYEARFPNGDLDFIRTEGFFLSKLCGAPYKKEDYRDGKISGRIEPVWHEWFDQKLVWNPGSGEMSVFINEEFRESLNVGDLLSVMDEDKIRLDLFPTGWWLHHSFELDFIEVSQ